MLLVYAMTRAVQHGWETSETIALLAVSAALIVAFVAVELRSHAPLLPMRMFRLRTLTGSNLAGAADGRGGRSRSSSCSRCTCSRCCTTRRMQTGVAYVTLTLAVIVFANVAQALTLRVGVRTVLPIGLLLVAAALVSTHGCRYTATTSGISSLDS